MLNGKIQKNGKSDNYRKIAKYENRKIEKCKIEKQKLAELIFFLLYMTYISRYDMILKLNVRLNGKPNFNDTKTYWNRFKNG